MRKVSLRMNEEQKYQVIKELVDHGGNKLRAALKLGVTVRTVNRHISTCKVKGKAAFVHGNRHRPPANSLSKEISNLIVSLYQEKYADFNFAHYKDLLSENENIDVSYATVYRVSRRKTSRPHISAERRVKSSEKLNYWRRIRPSPTVKLRQRSVASVDDQLYALRELCKHAEVSPEFDVIVPSTPKKRYIPPHVSSLEAGLFPSDSTTIS